MESDRVNANCLPNFSQPLNGMNTEDSGSPIVSDASIFNLGLESLQGRSTEKSEFTNNVLSFRLLPETTCEFKEIQREFLEDNLLVTSVREVLNPYIKQAFKLKRHFHYDDITPLLLYHGTKKKYVSSICTFNFNWRYNGRENGVKFGKGVNFSDKPIYAAKFCNKKNVKGVIIMAEVLIKRISPGLLDLELPPEGFDTTLGKGTRVFVKFDDNEFCPKYVVNFKKST